MACRKGIGAASQAPVVPLRDTAWVSQWRPSMNPIFPVVIAAVLAACPALAVAQAQSQTDKIVTRTFAGKPVRLVIPAGFCLIDRDSPSGRRFYQLQEELNRGTNVVGAIFADCKEWAQRQATPSYRIRRYGAYLFQLTGGKEVLFPSQVTRELSGKSPVSNRTGQVWGRKPRRTSLVESWQTGSPR